jgi:hypothetical protein
MPSLTVFALLNEGHKLDVYDKKMLLTISAYPHMDEDQQIAVRASLQLPDDLLSDILGDETPDDINTLKEALENGN